MKITYHQNTIKNIGDIIMLKYLFYIFIILFTVDCHKDNTSEPNVTKDPSLVGRWQLVSLKIDTSYYNPNDFENMVTRIEFKSDGTGNIWLENYGNPDQTMPILWSTSGDVLKIEGEDDFNYATYGITLIISYIDYSIHYELTYGKQT